MSAAIDARTFSPAAYGKLIADFRERGYEARGFSKTDTNARHLIVRHDVDFSLTAAQSMAEQEAELGITTTFFVLLRTEFYNALSQEGLAALHRIADCGHTIGLHFDAALYADEHLSIEQAVTRECGLLEAALGRPVTVLSFHRPTADRIGQKNEIAGRINAYGPRFVNEMGYCSDSRGAWHHGTPLDHPAVRDGRALQLLIHPFWWTLPALPPTDRLCRFLDERAALLNRELARHCTVHQA